jgi:hypothetical protein
VHFELHILFFGAGAVGAKAISAPLHQNDTVPCGTGSADQVAPAGWIRGGVPFGVLFLHEAALADMYFSSQPELYGEHCRDVALFPGNVYFPPDMHFPQKNRFFKIWRPVQRQRGMLN